MVEKHSFIPQQFNSTGILDTEHFSNNFHRSLCSLMHFIWFAISLKNVTQPECNSLEIDKI